MKIVIEADSVEELVAICASLTEAQKPPVVDAAVGMMKFVDFPVKDLDLTARALNCLHSEEIFMVSQLLSMSDNDLLRLPNLGRTSLKEIRQSLRRMVVPYSQTPAAGSDTLQTTEGN